jgi:RNA polymerase sigma-70 factor (ECF subfamily)
MEDKDIIGLYFERSEEAIRHTKDKYDGLCRSIAGNILSVAGDREECVSDAYLALWNAIPPQKPQNLGAYLAKTVRNLALNRRKAEQTQKRGANQSDIIFEELESVLASSETVETAYERERIRRLIEGYLSRLTADKRRAFVMRYWFFDSIGNIADSLGMTKAQIKMLLMRVRKDLKRYLESQGVGLEA